MGKLTISMAIFNSYAKLPEGKKMDRTEVPHLWKFTETHYFFQEQSKAWNVPELIDRDFSGILVIENTVTWVCLKLGIPQV